MGLQPSHSGMSSKMPVPAQLQERLAQAKRVRVIEGGPGAEAHGARVLLDSSAAGVVGAIVDGLAVVESEASMCLCGGNPTIELYDGTSKLATIGMHHGIKIRWDAWSSDARLKDGGALVKALADAGVTGPLAEFNGGPAVDAVDPKAVAVERWKAAMPLPLVVHWDATISRRFTPEQAWETMSQAMPVMQDRVRALLNWYGAGSRKYTSFPSYEGFALDVLLLIPPAELDDVLRSGTLTARETDGARALFDSWNFEKSGRVVADDLRAAFSPTAR